ncbi:hypothetical protein WH47_07436 [Habropoda laboriosa]|uniref:Uncharacterized protein n=1 Tax=Habropoda laboriosa TaxID=597456 RepID=A0A0L7QPX8_9HYME|nr:hypothetical protein WH47_07436 [Habropoda laboriosa]
MAVALKCPVTSTVNSPQESVSLDSTSDSMDGPTPRSASLLRPCYLARSQSSV